MGSPRLLPGEKIEATLRPHPFSFLGRYFMAGWPALWAAILFGTYRSNWWANAENGQWYEFWSFLYGNMPSAFILMTVGLLLMGAIIAVTAIRWRVFFFYAAAAAVTIIAVAALGDVSANYATHIPAILAATSIPGMVWTEADRRGHRYYLTNLRIVFQGGAFVKHERQLRFESVTDLDATQGILGRMLNYGTIIPVTQSGFGLGADQSNAAIGVGVGGSKAGIGGGVGVMAGGGKEVQVGRARSFHQLTGVKPFGDTKFLLEGLIQAATATPYLREQVDLQRKMVDRLDSLEGRLGPRGGEL